jgi:hypothetical protein
MKHENAYRQLVFVFILLILYAIGAGTMMVYIARDNALQAEIEAKK